MNSIVTQRFIKCHDKLKEESRVRSSRQFALSLDYLPQSLSEILRGRRDVTIELLRKAVAAYKFNPIYLYTGEGPMFLSESEEEGFRVLTIVTNAESEERIVHVPLPAQPGYAEESHKPGFIESLPAFSLPDYKYQNGPHRSFEVVGDSMEPSLFEGDKVICRFVDPTLWEVALQDNQAYVLVTQADVLVRRIVNKLKEEHRLQVHSDNAFYQPAEVAMGSIREIWQIRSVIRPFGSEGRKKLENQPQDLLAIKETVQKQSAMISELHHLIKQLLDGPKAL